MIQHRIVDALGLRSLSKVDAGDLWLTVRHKLVLFLV